jgi:DNA-binding MarR family transcriptional regulator
MEAQEQHDAAEPEPRWLQGIERDAWMSLIGVIIRLPAALDAQLQRDAGLSHFEYIVMVNLSSTEGHVMRMSALAGLCYSSLSRLSHVVARLERRGWLRREPCPDDGRATLATLTPDGFAKLASAAPGHVEAVRAYVIDALDDEQLGRLHEIDDAILGRLDGDTTRR